MIEADLHPKLKAFAVNLSEADKANMPKGLNGILNLSPEQRTPGQRQTLSNYFKNTGPGVQSGLRRA